jgi:hypothetical protein
MRKATLAFVALAIGVALYGQAPDSAPPPPHPGGPHEFHMDPGDFGFGPHPGKVVTGAPFSADVTHQNTQTLTDGNTIQHSVTGRVARDSQGRTYMQHSMNDGPLAQNGPKQIVFLSDPVAGYTYVLDSENKTAMRRAFKTPPEGAAAHPHGMPQEGTDLGTQTINGVSAQGKSFTHTIPAGEMGNAKPIVSTSEVWYSSDLQIPVMAKHNDPRSGAAVFTLTNIQRGDPPASLFQVPSDYTIKDAPQGGEPHHPPMQ